MSGATESTGPMLVPSVRSVPLTTSLLSGLSWQFIPLIQFVRNEECEHEQRIRSKADGNSVYSGCTRVEFKVRKAYGYEVLRHGPRTTGARLT